MSASEPGSGTRFTKGDPVPLCPMLDGMDWPPFAVWLPFAVKSIATACDEYVGPVTISFAPDVGLSTL